jgi:hypothetical protein
MNDAPSEETSINTFVQLVSRQFSGLIAIVRSREASFSCSIAALWPERRKAMVSVGSYLVSGPDANKAPLPPVAEYQWWYQYYFATERGKLGYDKYRHDFGKLIWRTASPKWDFDDATFDRTAASFNNPDYVAIVIHNYRFRIGLADGERKYERLEKQVDEAPVIAVPTITLEGDANGWRNSAPLRLPKEG